jgi:hypothetical protein
VDGAISTAAAGFALVRRTSLAANSVRRIMTKEVNKLIKSTSSKEIVPSMGPLITSAISSDSSSTVLVIDAQQMVVLVLFRVFCG